MHAPNLGSRIILRNLFQSQRCKQHRPLSSACLLEDTVKEADLSGSRLPYDLLCRLCTAIHVDMGATHGQTVLVDPVNEQAPAEGC